MGSIDTAIEEIEEVDRIAPRNEGEFDVFISHATEDKDFAGPLAHGLRSAGLRVWFDEFELGLGDSLNEKINYGLSRSRFGVVVLSPTFFKKHWAQLEMNGFVARQTTGERIILPIWHRITKNEIIEQAPGLADIVALNSSTQSMEEIVGEIVEKVGGGESPISGPQLPTATAHSSGPTFAVFYIAQAETAELPPEEKPEPSFSAFEFPPTDWVSVVNEDEELEYTLDGTLLRVRLDWGNQWSGDEYLAHQLISGDQPFALTLRLNNGGQLYFPSVINASPSRVFMSSSRSGWMTFQLQQ